MKEVRTDSSYGHSFLAISWLKLEKNSLKKSGGYAQKNYVLPPLPGILPSSIKSILWAPICFEVLYSQQQNTLSEELWSSINHIKLKIIIREDLRQSVSSKGWR